MSSVIFVFFSGVEKSDRVDILPPSKVKNKGSGAGGRRLQSGKEKGMDLQNKSKRKCGRCGEYAGHNSRKCPKV